MSAPELDTLRSELLDAIARASTLAKLEEVRVAALGKKGLVSALMQQLGTLPPEARKDFGQAVNALKTGIGDALEAKRAELSKAATAEKLVHERADVTFPVREGPLADGRIHPVSQVTEEIIAIFGEMGFVVAEGSDVEDDFNNFAALNIPPEHPARQMQDTFYLEAEQDGQPLLLRTHTSPVQIRTMEAGPPPYRVIMPGRTYRRDSDMTHTPMFHQVEGLLVGKDVSMAHLKGVLRSFVNAFFERSLAMRFRPSYFPFTEPSAEVDIGWDKGDGTAPGWLEILGCGMVHPNVLRACNVDPEMYTGYAFGMGVERLAMLRYGVTDLRQFFENDLEFLRQFH